MNFSNGVSDLLKAACKLSGEQNQVDEVSRRNDYPLPRLHVNIWWETMLIYIIVT